MNPSFSYPRNSRDPIHHWIGFSGEERKVVDSAPVQRLRHIHQLAMTSLVYPGATHMRFEHSLGVMHLASQIYDVVTDPEHVSEDVRSLLPEIHEPSKLMMWRGILRMAALCHDIGHIAYSHAAEKELLPRGWTHERITYQLITSPEMKPVWDDLDPYMRPEQVARIAIGAEELLKFAPKATPFTTWEALLSEIIVDDFFGADRIDYLLRDSYHAGVVYGQFDHFRLIESMRILPAAPEGDAAESEDDSEPREPRLGIVDGGRLAAESMVLARFFTYSQVYYQKTRIIYDAHLSDFLKAWLPDGKFPIDVKSFLRITDNEVMAALLVASKRPSAPGHEAAKAIVTRNHFRVLYEPKPADLAFERPAHQVYVKARRKFGAANVKYEERTVKISDLDYPVEMADHKTAAATSLSVVKVEPKISEYVFINPNFRTEAREWLNKNRDTLITKKRGKDQ